MAEHPLTVNDRCKAEMGYHGKFGYTIGRIQKISIMSIIDICYISFFLGTQTVAPNLTVFQGLELCIQ